MAKYVGQRIKRTEDPRLIQGLSHYVDDIKLPDTLHVAFLRSMYAHAKIKSIDTSEASHAPGVVAVYTGADVANKIGPVPCAGALPGLKIPNYTVLATDHVTFVGHPIAAVVATDRYAARDAIDLIMVDYEELPVVVDVEEAAKGAPFVYEEYGDNIAYTLTSGEGDIEEALGKADHVIKQRILHQRLIPVAMEPRGVLARYYPGEKELTVWTSTQIPHLARTQLAIMLGVPENKVRLIAPEVGGGFGSKLNVYAEEALISWISMQIGKPVKWIESRRENFQSTIHGRGQVGYIEVGCKNDGTITGLRYNVFADMGAYLQLLTPAIPTLTGLMLSGCYKIPAIQMNVTAVFTNKMSTDAYRGAGRPEATQVIERAADLVAAELGMDPVQVRRKNFPEPTEFPFKTATGLFYDSGNYQGALDKALAMADYKAVQKLKEKATELAAHLLGADASTVSFKEGRFSVEAAMAAAGGDVDGAKEASAPKSVSIQEVALAAHVAHQIPPGFEPGLSATNFFEPANFTFPFGTHIVQVEIDRDTGSIEFKRYVAVDDCGKVLNPMLVDGQVHGGIVQSIGQALYEEAVYDEQGQLVTGTLMDYAIPKASMVPWLELDRTETPSPVNPMGVKGVGEAGTIGATPAIVGAIVDALSPFGIRHLDMPIKPENIWRILNKAN